MQTGTQFQPVLTDPTTSDPEQVDKVVFVSGKLYYDLQKEKTERGLNDRVALIRIEVSESKRGVHLSSFLTDRCYFVM